MVHNMFSKFLNILHHQHHLGTCQKCSFSGLTPDLQNHKLWGWQSFNNYSMALKFENHCSVRKTYLYIEKVGGDGALLSASSVLNIYVICHFGPFFVNQCLHVNSRNHLILSFSRRTNWPCSSAHSLPAFHLMLEPRFCSEKGPPFRTRPLWPEGHQARSFPIQSDAAGASWGKRYEGLATTRQEGNLLLCSGVLPGPPGAPDSLGNTW